MTLYRDKSGEPCEAIRFTGGHIDGDEGMQFDVPKGQDWAWLTAAMRDGTVEFGAFGSSLILNFRGGSYGLARGDWVIRKRGGEITHCRGDRFAQQYEAVG